MYLPRSTMFNGFIFPALFLLTAWYRVHTKVKLDHSYQGQYKVWNLADNCLPVYSYFYILIFYHFYLSEPVQMLLYPIFQGGKRHSPSYKMPYFLAVPQSPYHILQAQLDYKPLKGKDTSNLLFKSFTIVLSPTFYIWWTYTFFISKYTTNLRDNKYSLD